MDVNDLAFAHVEDDCLDASEVASECFMVDGEIALVVAVLASFY